MNNTKPPTLIETIFLRILEEKILSDFDIKNCSNILYSMAFDMDISEAELQQRINKFRKSIPNFLAKFEDELIELEKMNSRLYKMIEKDRKYKASLPPLAFKDDAPGMVTFIRSLKDESYSFSAAEKIVGTSRQTLKGYAKKGLHGLKEHQKGESMRLLKADIINYYRDKNFKNYDPFENLL